MRYNYERPTIFVDQNLSEGVYLASGQTVGTVQVCIWKDGKLVV